MAFELVTLFGAQMGWESSATQNSTSITNSAGRRIIGYFWDVDQSTHGLVALVSRIRVVEPVLSAKAYAVGNGAPGTLANGLNGYTLPSSGTWQRYVAYGDANNNNNRTLYNYFEIPVDEWDMQLQASMANQGSLASLSITCWAVLEEGVR